MCHRHRHTKFWHKTPLTGTFAVEVGTPALCKDKLKSYKTGVFFRTPSTVLYVLTVLDHHFTSPIIFTCIQNSRRSFGRRFLLVGCWVALGIIHEAAFYAGRGGSKRSGNAYLEIGSVTNLVCRTPSRFSW
jgi:hypothetical protein